MNEQIRALAKEAGIYYYRAGKLQVDMEKFAELIVKECAEVIHREVSMKYKDGGDTEEFMGGHYAGSVLARVVINQHFGINS